MATRWVRRFTPVQQWTHALFAACFSLLLITGSVLFAPQLQAFAIGAAGQATRFLHRVGAVGLVGAALAYIILDFRHFRADLRAILTWSRGDLQWLSGAATRYYWGGEKGDIPDEGLYNAGQKLNALVQAVGFAVTLVTGLIMWFGIGRVSPATFRASLLVHEVAAIAAVTFFVAHLYMTVVHPMTRESIMAMITGRVTEDYAEIHHPQWYSQIRRETAPHGE
jgi:formate dehydrogenase subunit gamma